MRSRMLKHSPTPPPDHHSRSPSPSPLSLPTSTESIVQETIESVEKIILRWRYSEDSVHCAATSLFTTDGGREDADEFFSAVNDLQAAIRFLASTNASPRLLVRCQEFVKMAMKRLGREFCIILKSDESLDPGSVSARSPVRSDRRSDSDDGVVLEIYSDGEVDIQRTPTVQAMNDLKSIADCMIHCGYGDECAKIYKTVRKSIVDEALYQLGIDRLSLSMQNHKLDWEAIQDKIKNWLSAMKIAVKSIFSGERTLCDLVFLSSAKIRESCFSEIAGDSALSLFGFPEQVASKCKRSPEKLFRLLDLYEGISEFSPEIFYTFSSDSSSVVRSQVETSLLKLREASRTTLAEFEAAIQKDSSKTPVIGGKVHPLTRYVMNYLAFLADYAVVLDEILEGWPLNLQAPLPEEYFGGRSSGDTQTNVAVRFIWLILVLLSNLDAKAELYKEVSLSYLFLTNNLRYVVGKVKTTELQRVLDEDWVAKHDEKVKQYAANYERLAWTRVVAPLDGKDDHSTDRTADVSLERAKERFKKFNGAFLEVQRKHMEWVVVDRKLREEIKDSLARNIVTKYREMYERYRDKLARGNGSADSVVRYAPEDLENYLWGLLFGCSDGDSSSRRSWASTTSSCSSSSLDPRSDR